MNEIIKSLKEQIRRTHNESSVLLLMIQNHLLTAKSDNLIGNQDTVYAKTVLAKEEGKEP
jgi:hypothetical protein